MLQRKTCKITESLHREIENRLILVTLPNFVKCKNAQLATLMVAKEGGLWNVVEGNSGNFAFEQDLKN